LCACCVAPLFDGVYARTRRLDLALALMFAAPELNPAARWPACECAQTRSPPRHELACERVLVGGQAVRYGTEAYGHIAHLQDRTVTFRGRDRHRVPPARSQPGARARARGDASFAELHEGRARAGR